MTDKEVLRTFGANVRAHRLGKGWSQRELGKRMGGVFPTAISGLERGRKNSGLLNVRKVAVALQVSIDELLTEDFDGLLEEDLDV